MKTVYFIFFLILIAINSNGQDVIIFSNGDELQVRVKEVLDDNIKYIRFDNLNGPLYTTAKSEIFMIKYENGAKDVFKLNENVKNKGEINPLNDISNSKTDKKNNVIEVEGWKFRTDGVYWGTYEPNNNSITYIILRFIDQNSIESHTDFFFLVEPIKKKNLSQQGEAFLNSNKDIYSISGMQNLINKGLRYDNPLNSWRVTYEGITSSIDEIDMNRLILTVTRRETNIDNSKQWATLNFTLHLNPKNGINSSLDGRFYVRNMTFAKIGKNFDAKYIHLEFMPL